MKPVTLDGWLLVLLATSPAITAALGSDEASKYIDPFVLWACRSSFGVIGVGLGALKGYRSTQYATYKQNGGSDTQFIAKNDAQRT